MQQEIADQTAAQVAADMTLQILANDQFDTGALANSPYATSVSGSGYAAAAAAARSRNEDVELIDEIELPAAGLAAVSSVVIYAEPQNNGTPKLPARPFLEPALEKNNNTIEEVTRKVFAARLEALE